MERKRDGTVRTIAHILNVGENFVICIYVNTVNDVVNSATRIHNMYYYHQWNCDIEHLTYADWVKLIEIFCYLCLQAYQSIRNFVNKTLNVIKYYTKINWKTLSMTQFWLLYSLFCSSCWILCSFICWCMFKNNWCLN